jgi:ATP-dependent Clp protease adapter protein ClpS
MTKLFIHNDNHHSFDEVQMHLSDMFHMPITQTCSVANIIHTVGKCCVFSGDFNMANLYQNELKGMNYKTELVSE